MVLRLQPEMARSSNWRCGREEGIGRDRTEVVGSIDGGKVANVRGSRAVVEGWVRRIGDERRSIGRNAGVPRGAVIEVAGVSVVDTELEAVSEVATHVELERVVVARRRPTSMRLY